MPDAENRIGVALTRCYYCGEGDRIVLNTRLTPEHARRVEEMHDKVIDMDPCQKCKDLMSQGIIIITIDSEKSGEGWEKSDTPNPHRTGGFFVLTEEACGRFMPPELFDWAMKHRFMFMEHEGAENLGLFEAAKKEEDGREVRSGD